MRPMMIQGGQAGSSSYGPGSRAAVGGAAGAGRVGDCGLDCGRCGRVDCGDGVVDSRCIQLGCGGYDEVASFVGPGQGAYRAETEYMYVGKGAGDVEMVMVPSKLGGNWCYCLVLVPLVVLLLWLLMPLLSGDTTTTTLPLFLSDETLRKECSIYGDPHAMTFDGLHSDYYTSGEFWIVKSDTVKVQGKYAPTHATNGLAVTKQIAVGGSFLKGHLLIIGEEHATWDGQEILVNFPSTFSDAEGLVNIVYNNVGQPLQAGREGKALHVLHVTLPGDAMMQINRWNEEGEGRYINTKITMPRQEGQDGQCGNFNGVAADDARLMVKARLGKDGVAAEDLMFPGGKTPVNQELENCPDETLISAHEACKAVSNNFWPHMHCLVTVCNGGTAVA